MLMRFLCFIFGHCYRPLVLAGLFICRDCGKCLYVPAEAIGGQLRNKDKVLAVVANQYVPGEFELLYGEPGAEKPKGVIYPREES